MQRLRQLTQSRFIRSVLIVATGTAGAQAITMAFAPVITRLYGPEAFGLLGTFMAILTVLTPMAALTYPIAIVLPKQDEDARGLAKLSILLAAATSSLALILLLTWGDWLAEQLGAGAISQYLWLIPFAMLFSALHQVMEQWLIRHRQFRITARVAVIQSVLLNSAKVGAGFFLPLASVLIILQTLTSGLHALLLWLGIRGTRTQDATSAKTSCIKQLAIKHKDFPRYRAPEVTINAASQGLPILMLAAFFGPASAGFYTLAQTVMGIPAGLIGKSVGDVFYPRISEAANNREALYPLVRKATLLLAAVGFVPFATVIACGPWLFSFVFGSEWETAGEYARWLAVWLFFLFINGPSVKSIPIIKAQAFQLSYTSLTIAIRLATLFLAYKIYQSEIAAIIGFGISGALINIILISIVLKKCRKFDIGENK